MLELTRLVAHTICRSSGTTQGEPPLYNLNSCDVLTESGCRSIEDIYFPCISLHNPFLVSQALYKTWIQLTGGAFASFEYVEIDLDVLSGFAAASA